MDAFTLLRDGLAKDPDARLWATTLRFGIQDAVKYKAYHAMNKYLMTALDPLPEHVDVACIYARADACIALEAVWITKEEQKRRQLRGVRCRFIPEAYADKRTRCTAGVQTKYKLDEVVVF